MSGSVDYLIYKMLRVPARYRLAKASTSRGFGASVGYGKNLESVSGPQSGSVKLGSVLSFSGGGPLAHLADGSGVCSSGGTVVHAAVTTAANSDVMSDFLPLTVDYRSRAYAFGRIPSVFNRRERHGSDDEVLVSRIIDRAVRPLFPKGLVNQVQVIATAHASDRIHDPTVMSVNAASLALMRSSVDWAGPVGCVRVGMVAGKLQLNPTVEQMQSSSIDFVYAGTHNKALMLECVGEETPETVVAEAMYLAQKGVTAIIEEQLKVLNAVSGGTKSNHIQEQEAVEAVEAVDNLSLEKVMERADKGLYTVPPLMQKELNDYGLHDSIDMFSSCAGLSRKDRGMQENGIQKKLQAFLAASSEWGTYPTICRNMAVDTCMKKAFRCAVLGRDLRVDGRQFDEVRHVQATTDVLPSVHGSSFFGRGDTHVLSTATLGPLQDAKVTVSLDGSTSDSTASFSRINSVQNEGGKGEPAVASARGGGTHSQVGERRNAFFLHYDFPPYCTGVVGNATATNRRMVGHGNLAERALRPVMPDVTRFPYTVRAYAECTSSSGSSSMASCCSATLAMLDAGVPLKSSVAGVSVGLVTARDGDDTSPSVLTSPDSGGLKYRLLTDILGTEDHYGDMDFKIAGSRRGITAMQLDMKLPDGVELKVLEQALQAARLGRAHILQAMEGAIVTHRSQVKTTAPAAEMVSYDVERKRLLIGPGGEMIRYIEDTYQCSIDTSEDGLAYIFGADRASVNQAKALVKDIVTVLEPGDTLSGEVTEIKDFGVFVKLTRSQEAMLHLSELSHDAAILKQPLPATLAVGQKVDVQVLSVDKGTGAVRVSRKALLTKGEPDALSATTPDMVEPVEPGGVRDPLPTFPVVPPRKWSKDFFRNKVASEEDVKAAMGGTSGANGKEGEESRSERLHLTPAGNGGDKKSEKHPSRRLHKDSTRLEGSAKRESRGKSRGRGGGTDPRKNHAQPGASRGGNEKKTDPKGLSKGKAVRQSQSAGSGTQEDGGGLLKSILRYVGLQKGKEEPSHATVHNKAAGGDRTRPVRGGSRGKKFG